MRTLLPGLAISLIILASCGGGTNPAKSAVPIAGNWQMVLVSQANVVRTEAGFFLQTGNSLNGGLTITSNCSGLGSAQGQLSGTNVSIAVSQIAQTINLTGTAAADGSTMGGNYSMLASGCGNSNIGTWTASQIKPLNGNLQATFTSSNSSKPVFDFAGTITQGPNTGSSTAGLSGSMTSTNARCFSTASMTGLIGGTAVVFNLAASDGTSLGIIRGTITTDASTITGSYVFKNVNSPILANCGGGDSGTVAIAVQ